MPRKESYFSVLELFEKIFNQHLNQKHILFGKMLMSSTVMVSILCASEYYESRVMYVDMVQLHLLNGSPIVKLGKIECTERLNVRKD